MMRQLLCNAATAVAADTAILTPALQLPPAAAFLLSAACSQVITGKFSSYFGSAQRSQRCNQAHSQHAIW